MVKKISITDAENWEKIANDYIGFIKNNREGYLKYLLYGSLYTNLLNIADGIKNKKILDAGCGEGSFCRTLATRGAIVEGCDASQTMINETTKEGSEITKSIKYFLHDLTKKFNGHQTYDIVVSNLVLFNIGDIESVIKNISDVIKPGGRFIFSLLHPCFSITNDQCANLNSIGFNGGKIAFQIKKSYKSEHMYKRDYVFKKDLTYYHRPIETYVKALCENGFLIDSLAEPVLKLDQIYDNKYYHQHYLPRFLIIGATKLNRKNIL